VRRIVFLGVAVLAVLALAACGGRDDQTTAPAAAPADGVQELANVLDLRAAFEADAGKPRVLFLFSPT
jgi:predicted outer membrane protein